MSPLHSSDIIGAHHSAVYVGQSSFVFLQYWHLSRLCGVDLDTVYSLDFLSSVRCF